MDDAARRKVLGLVGLGVRGRLAVVGVQQVRDAAMRGKLRLALVALDVSKHSLDKVLPLLQARRVRVIDEIGAADLGAAVGRESTAAVGVVDSNLARGIRTIVEGGVTGARQSGSGGAR
jgi:ribosomal protein L7Ae-like RNA K-turn-binding protein